MQAWRILRSDKSSWVNALSSARFRLEADLRKALGPAVISAAPKGRTRDRTRPYLHPSKSAFDHSLSLGK
jgi:hypothetical protein